MEAAVIKDAKPWERIEFSPNDEGQPKVLYRLPVPGGWLVAHSWADTAGLVFLPDPDRSWDPSK